MTVRPVRLCLSRRKGFDMQALSRSSVRVPIDWLRYIASDRGEAHYV